MPAGNLTVSLWLRRTLPLPLQRLHGVRMILPVPRQSGQAAVDCMVMPMKLCCVRTVPVPLQRGQVSALVPGAAPVPPHWSQSSMRLDGDLLFRAEGRLFKCQLDARTDVVAAHGRVGAAARRTRPPPPKKLPNMSPRSPKSPKPRRLAAERAAAAFGLKFGIDARKAVLVVARALIRDRRAPRWPR